MEVRLIAAALALALVTACGGGPSAANKPYIDIEFPAGNLPAYAHAVDGSGGLWYVDGNDVVHAAEPNRRDVVHVAGTRGGTLFWYEGSIVVLTGDGMRFVRIGRKRQSVVTIPAAYAPIVGVAADPVHRGIVAAETAPNRLAVVDVWKWYGQTIPGGIEAYSTALAGGPHGKRYLLVADRRTSLVAVIDRRYAEIGFMRSPPNGCFAGTRSALQVPVLVHARDGGRAWVAAGEHVATIDLAKRRTLRTWDLDACAMQIVAGDARSAILMVSRPDGSGRYSTSAIRVDLAGVHALPQYGRIAGLDPDTLLDGYDRLWWYDTSAHAFVCRTPLNS